MGRYWILRDGTRHKLSPEDVLRVAPDDAEVHPLSTRLPRRARIGTPGEFQGEDTPAPLTAPARTVERLRLVNGRCRFAELGAA